jgi:hypothetical protein
MALSNYTELQAAISTELNVSTSGLATAVIVDAITRAEAKINRRSRLREQEQLSYATYAVASESIENRLIAIPTGMIEMLHLYAKKSSDADSEYEEIDYVDPGRIWEYYGDTNVLKFTVRDQIEMSRVVTNTHELMMHYIKKWDIATDATNYLLTNYPDVYLYGALAECEAHLRNDERVPMWKAMFDQGIAELNELDERGRDDAQLDTSEVSAMANRYSYFSITNG